MLHVLISYILIVIYMLEKNQTYLEVTNLSKSFGSFEAIKNISINIKEGEFVCFLGPSGCGKTTLLRCIAGLEIQSTGSVVQKNKLCAAVLGI